MKKKQKTAILLMLIGLVLIPLGYAITTYNSPQVNYTVEDVAFETRSPELTGHFGEGDTIFGMFSPPASPGGWELGCEPPNLDPYYGWISVAHVFAYADLYDPSYNRVSRLEFVLIYNPEQLGEHLFLFNLSRVIEMNATGSFPRVPVKMLDPNWFECGTANQTGTYTLEVWVGVSPGGSYSAPTAAIIKLGKRVEEVEYPNAYLLPTGIGVIIVGVVLSGYGTKINWRMKRSPSRAR